MPPRHIASFRDFLLHRLRIQGAVVLLRCGSTKCCNTLLLYYKMLSQEALELQKKSYMFIPFQINFLPNSHSLKKDSRALEIALNHKSVDYKMICDGCPRPLNNYKMLRYGRHFLSSSADGSKSNGHVVSTNAIREVSAALLIEALILSLIL